MAKITDIYALEVLDSRWNPTVEVHLTLDEKFEWMAIVPSWASTWVHEALELRDGDKSRYMWKWTLKAVENVNTSLKNELVWKEFSSIEDIDNAMIKLDWTKNKSNLWANAILWVSMAFCCADAKRNWKELFEYLGDWNVLPVPLMNVINWWAHADNRLDFQEFMIVPVWAQDFPTAVRMGTEIFHNLKSILKSHNHITAVWDEWGFAPNLDSNKSALDTLLEAIKKAGYNTDQVKISLDVASSEFFENWKYVLPSEDKTLTSNEMTSYYEDLVSNYPIISIEDWMAEDDFEGWINMTKNLGEKIMTVWDDLYVTNIERLEKWIADKQANAILIKLNQIGSVSETLKAIKMAQENWMNAIISHRSWETEDTFIADLAVATNAGFIKTGSLSRTDRIAKYNRLLRISHKLGEKAKYWK